MSPCQELLGFLTLLRDRLFHGPSGVSRTSTLQQFTSVQPVLLKGLEADPSPPYLHYSSWTGSKELIARLVPSGSSVLDIGCSSGLLGEQLHLRGCSVTGIERDETAAKLAEQKYETVFLGDIQALIELPEKFLGAFDLLVFADVLEHLRNPEAVLSHFLRYLRPEGKALVSIPNVANWLNRLQLLLGRWEYRDCGTLDRTHLKFYTYKSARRLVEESGLTIRRVICTSGLHSLDFRAGFRNPANAWKGLLGFQFIFECQLGGPT